MKKTWQIIAHEYSRHALRRRFIFALLSVPALMLVMAILVYMIVRIQTKTERIGYVDHSGLLANPLPAGFDIDTSDLVAYEAEQQAKTALDGGEIQAYYILSADFAQTGDARLIAIKAPASGTQEQFTEFVRGHLLASYPDEIVQRIIDGDHLLLRSIDGSRQLGEDDWIMILLPFFMGIIFMIAVFTSSGYLMQAVVEEKENRTIEILITSVSSQQLMIGKAIGLIAVGLNSTDCLDNLGSTHLGRGGEVFPKFTGYQSTHPDGLLAAGNFHSLLRNDFRFNDRHWRYCHRRSRRSANFWTDHTPSGFTVLFLFLDHFSTQQPAGSGAELLSANCPGCPDHAPCLWRDIHLADAVEPSSNYYCRACITVAGRASLPPGHAKLWETTFG